MKAGKGKPGRAKMLLVGVLRGQREGLDLGMQSMGPAIDHEGLDRGLALQKNSVPPSHIRGLERKGILHIEPLRTPMLLYQPLIDSTAAIRNRGIGMEQSKRKGIIKERMEAYTLLEILVLGMLMDLLKALDLVKMQPLLLPLEDPHMNLWKQDGTSEYTYGTGRRDAKKAMPIDHEGTNPPIDLAKMMPIRLLVLVLLPRLL